VTRKIRGVAFDMEGTLVNVEQPHFDGFYAVAEHLGLTHLGFTSDALSFEALIPGAIGGGDPFIIAELLKLAGEEPTEERVEELRVKIKMPVYDTALSHLRIEHRNGTRRFVKFITDNLGLPVAIGSLTPRAQAEALFSHSGVGAWFNPDKIVLRENVVSVKPAPDVYIETAHRMGIDPTEQLVFEDSGSGVRAAVAAGSLVIGVPVYTTASYTGKLTGLGAMAVFSDWNDPALYSLVKELART